jgi:hypothetical protein
VLPPSSTSRRRCWWFRRGVDVRKVDLSIELQILAYHEQRKLLAAQTGAQQGTQQGAPTLGATGVQPVAQPRTVDHEAETA